LVDFFVVVVIGVVAVAVVVVVVADIVHRAGRRLNDDMRNYWHRELKR